MQWIPVQGGGGVCCLGYGSPNAHSLRRLSHLSVQACLLPVAPQFPRHPRHRASQAISFKVAKLSVESCALNAQIVANIIIVVVMRFLLIACPWPQTTQSSPYFSTAGNSALRPRIQITMTCEECSRRCIFVLEPRAYVVSRTYRASPLAPQKGLNGVMVQRD